MTRRDSSKASKPTRVISKARLAKLKGVTRSAVTKACAPGGALEDAALRGGRVDLEHPATKSWLAVGATPKAVEPIDLDAVGDLRLREIDERYGSVTGLGDYIELRKKTAETQRIELQNAETKGQIVSRDFVRTHVIGLIDATFRRLLTDTVKTFSTRAQAMTQAGASLEEIQHVGADLMSATLASLKGSAARSARSFLTKPVVARGDAEKGI